MFMLLNRGVQFDEKFLISNGLDGYLRIPLSDEQVKPPQELLTSLKNVFNAFKGVGKSDVRPTRALLKLLLD